MRNVKELPGALDPRDGNPGLSDTASAPDLTPLDSMAQSGLPNPFSEDQTNDAAGLSQYAKTLADKLPTFDDTWFTKDRMEAMAAAGQKAVSDEAAQLAQLGNESGVPAAAQLNLRGTPAAALNLQVMRGALPQFKTFARGGQMPRQQRRSMYASGGALTPLMMLDSLMDIKAKIGAAPAQNQGALNTGLQQGPGTGRSDSIHARLANGGNVATGDGEYVLPADVVSFLGGHSTAAGGKVLDAFVEQTRNASMRQLGSLPSPRK